eukprot:TRINITY_DN17819_c0_g1_i2.p1 TRINITY_DN17819_c0_g1~~TRINITY_DN17819_c0_g1_i2.p1  ORF type:complete len:938 (-),score=233.50 TRINITY_DN17819_c0_g1_i2:296-3109(-)
MEASEDMQLSATPDELHGLIAQLPVAQLERVAIDGVPFLHHLVAISDRHLLLQALKRHPGVNVPHGLQQRTALHFAVSERRSDSTLVKLLLNFHADPNIQDASGDTPMHTAIREGHMDAAMLMVQNSANLEVENLYGEKCVDLAGEDAPMLNEVEARRLEKLHAFLGAAEGGDERRLLEQLRSGMLANACDEDGMVPLHFAVRQNHVDIVHALLEAQGDPNSAHAGGKTPLHFACEEVAPPELTSRVRIIGMLLEACAGDLDLADSDGNTAMHIGCMSNAMEAVALLTDAGASTTHLNHRGLTAYHCLGYEQGEIEGMLEAARCAIQSGELSIQGHLNKIQVEKTVQQLILRGHKEHKAREAVADCGSTDVDVCLTHLINSAIPAPLGRQRSLPELPKVVRKKSASKVPPAKKKKLSESNSDDESQTWTGSDDDENEVFLYSSEEEEEPDEMEDMEIDQPVVARWIASKADAILEERQVLIDEVCDVTMLMPSDAAELLRHQKWNKDSCLQAWFSGSDRVLQEIGVLPTFSMDQPKVPDGVSCTMFASENCEGYLDQPIPNPGQKYTGLSCGHFMCNHCWREFLQAKIESNQIHPLRCPLCTVPTSQQAAAKALVPGCVINSTVIQQLVSPPHFKRYQYFLGKAYVEVNPCIKWCNFPDCSYVVNGSLMTHKFGDQPTVTCGQGHQFCFDCVREPHNPASCQMVHEWEIRNADQGGDETMIWVQLHSAPCPKCGIAIQKNQGCNHMTCRPPVGCGFDFCWICKEKWGTCDYYSCNKFKKGEVKPDDSAADARLKEKANMLEKYLFYWKRYKAQDLTDKFQAELEEKLKGTIDSIRAESTDPTALSLCEKIHEGLAQLFRCRMALKWSFVRAFCLADKTDKEIVSKDLFEQWLGQLAGVCDRLMMELEKPPEEMSLAVLSDQLAIAKKNFDNLDVNMF